VSGRTFPVSVARRRWAMGLPILYSTATANKGTLVEAMADRELPARPGDLQRCPVTPPGRFFEQRQSGEVGMRKKNRTACGAQGEASGIRQKAGSRNRHGMRAHGNRHMLDAERQAPAIGEPKIPARCMSQLRDVGPLEPMRP
jgi:hypothetical protein